MNWITIGTQLDHICKILLDAIVEMPILYAVVRSACCMWIIVVALGVQPSSHMHKNPFTSQHANNALVVDFSCHTVDYDIKLNLALLRGCTEPYKPVNGCM